VLRAKSLAPTELVLNLRSFVHPIKLATLMRSNVGMAHAKPPWKTAENLVKKETLSVLLTHPSDAPMAPAEKRKLTAQLFTTVLSTHLCYVMMEPVENLPTIARVVNAHMVRRDAQTVPVL
jgi:hypothetical protein